MPLFPRSVADERDSLLTFLAQQRDALLAMLARRHHQGNARRAARRAADRRLPSEPGTLTPASRRAAGPTGRGRPAGGRPRRAGSHQRPQTSAPECCQDHGHIRARDGQFNNTAIGVAYDDLKFRNRNAEGVAALLQVPFSPASFPDFDGMDPLIDRNRRALNAPERPPYDPVLRQLKFSLPRMPRVRIGRPREKAANGPDLSGAEGFLIGRSSGHGGWPEQRR